jgi:hypothetical protein
LRCFRIVKPDALHETAVPGAPRICDDQIEKRALLGTPARETDHHHDYLPISFEKGVILRHFFAAAQGGMRAGGASAVKAAPPGIH